MTFVRYPGGRGSIGNRRNGEFVYINFDNGSVRFSKDISGQIITEDRISYNRGINKIWAQIYYDKEKNIIKFCIQKKRCLERSKRMKYQYGKVVCNITDILKYFSIKNQGHCEYFSELKLSGNGEVYDVWVYLDRESETNK